MTTEELAWILREIDIEEVIDPELRDAALSYDGLIGYLKEAYTKRAAAYLKYLDIEVKKA